MVSPQIEIYLRLEARVCLHRSKLTDRKIALNASPRRKYIIAQSTGTQNHNWHAYDRPIKAPHSPHSCSLIGSTNQQLLLRFERMPGSLEYEKDRWPSENPATQTKPSPSEASVRRPLPTGLGPRSNITGIRFELEKHEIRFLSRFPISSQRFGSSQA